MKKLRTHWLVVFVVWAVLSIAFAGLAMWSIDVMRPEVRDFVSPDPRPRSLALGACASTAVVVLAMMTIEIGKRATTPRGPK